MLIYSVNRLIMLAQGHVYSIISLRLLDLLENKGNRALEFIGTL